MMDGVATTLAGSVEPVGEDRRRVNSGFWGNPRGERARPWYTNLSSMGGVCQWDDGSCPRLFCLLAPARLISLT